MAVMLPAKVAFTRRGITAGELPPAQEALLPLEEQAETKRATLVESNFGAFEWQQPYRQPGK